jgi:hypothetical protein
MHMSKTDYASHAAIIKRLRQNLKTSLDSSNCESQQYTKYGSERVEESALRGLSSFKVLP